MTSRSGQPAPPFALGLGLAQVMDRGVARSVRRIVDERVPLREAAESAERWSWATNWGSLAHSYGSSSGYTGPIAAASRAEPAARPAPTTH